ncbi:MAG: M28 family peptidase [Acidobacteria bacterium]|nr:M28 family peptidase [Acidobacteriota bacterium]
MRNISRLPARRSCGALILICLTAAACAAAPREQPAPAEYQTQAPPPERIPIGELPDIDPAALLAHVRVLSSDAFEGRAPGSAGEEKTVAYLVDKFKAAGLRPGNTDGTYIQKVPLVGITPAPAPLVLRKGADTRTLAFKDDFVAWTKHVADSASLQGSEVVFVGYGASAPEYNWDDYKGVDLKGKTLLMLVNDPPVPDPENPGELDPKVFGGKAMTYYGRWTYKHEIAAQKGAAGVFVIHETGPAGYPFEVVQSMTGERFDLVTPDKNMGRAAVEGWISLEQATALMAMGGQKFDELKKQAATREFKPVPLGVSASITIKNTLRTIDSKNVLAKIEGSDPQLRNEYVVYTAHWDHLGKDDTGIYHGAEDNALGCAALIELGRAFSRMAVPPKRSILFLSVTAEEQGLLGSQYYTVMPVYPLAKTIADINMDSWNTSGRTRDLTIIGDGASDLDDYARDAAGEQGRVIRPDPEPEKGFYYRSDHFNFAKMGVPALNPDAGIDYIGKPEGYGEKVRAEWTENRYHKPADVIMPDWDLTGTVEDLKVYLAVGYRVAQADTIPAWKPGSEFKATRERMLAK